VTVLTWRGSRLPSRADVARMMIPYPDLGTGGCSRRVREVTEPTSPAPYLAGWEPYISLKHELAALDAQSHEDSGGNR
jgi:hypothetical protein